jgi:anti-sigma factor RsiW
MSKSRQWQGPTAQELAAYVDGELAGEPLLRRRIEAWLSDHPVGAAEVESLRELKHVWRATTPAQPSEADWRCVQAHLPQKPAPPSWDRRASVWAALLATALTGAAAAFAVFWPVKPSSPQPPTVQNHGDLLDDGEVLSVASADEIEVLQVEGPDSHTLVVNNLPMHRPLELLNPGEVSLMHPMLDPMMHARTDASGRPMFWARTDDE